MSGASQSQPGNRAALSACCNACDVTCCPSGACASTVGSSSKSITSTNPRSAMSHRPSPLNPGSALRSLWSSWCDPKAPNYWPRLRLLSLFEMYWPQGVAEYLTRSSESSEKAQSLPEEILEVGDKIVVFVHFQAWPKGGGQLREGRIADVYTVQDGKIVQMQAYSDPEEARIALGLSPHR